MEVTSSKEAVATRANVLRRHGRQPRARAAPISPRPWPRSSCAAWALLAEQYDPDLLEEISTTVPLDRAAEVAVQVLAGKVRGRTVVDVNA